MDPELKQHFIDRWERYFPTAALPICASIVYHPYHEIASDRPRAVLGMFDVSARPCVEPDVLTFAVPRPKFTRMVAQMDESFLITKSWSKVRRRQS
jgi:hypothetical protein